MSLKFSVARQQVKDTHKKLKYHTTKIFLTKQMTFFEYITLKCWQILIEILCFNYSDGGRFSLRYFHFHFIPTLLNNKELRIIVG
jgi:hypothetical protein